jgi:hypothetical protein
MPKKRLAHTDSFALFRDRSPFSLAAHQRGSCSVDIGLGHYCEKDRRVFDGFGDSIRVPPCPGPQDLTVDASSLISPPQSALCAFRNVLSHC